MSAAPRSELSELNLSKFMRSVALSSEALRPQSIQVMPSKFSKNNTAGDFLWEIKQNISPGTLYIFNDNYQDHKSNRAGENSAQIRPYNGYQEFFQARSAGISTGDIPNGVGFKNLFDTVVTIDGPMIVKDIIDKDLEEIRLLLATGQYTEVKYSTNGSDENLLGTDVFRVGLEVLRYITEQIKALPTGKPAEYDDVVSAGPVMDLPSEGDRLLAQAREKRLLRRVVDPSAEVASDGSGVVELAAESSGATATSAQPGRDARVPAPMLTPYVSDLLNQQKQASNQRDCPAARFTLGKCGKNRRKQTAVALHPDKNAGCVPLATNMFTLENKFCEGQTDTGAKCYADTPFGTPDPDCIREAPFINPKVLEDSPATSDSSPAPLGDSAATSDSSPAPDSAPPSSQPAPVPPPPLSPTNSDASASSAAPKTIAQILDRRQEIESDDDTDDEPAISEPKMVERTKSDDAKKKEFDDMIARLRMIGIPEEELQMKYTPIKSPSSPAPAPPPVPAPASARAAAVPAPAPPPEKSIRQQILDRRQGVAGEDDDDDDDDGITGPITGGGYRLLHLKVSPDISKDALRALVRKQMQVYPAYGTMIM